VIQTTLESREGSEGLYRATSEDCSYSTENLNIASNGEALRGRKYVWITPKGGRLELRQLLLKKRFKIAGKNRLLVLLLRRGSPRESSLAVDVALPRKKILLKGYQRTGMVFESIKGYVLSTERNQSIKTNRIVG